MKLLFASVILIFSGRAFAEAKKPDANMQGQSKTVKYKAKTEVDFDDTSIDGAAKTPFGQFLTSRNSDTPDGFVKIRKNFHDRMIKSIADLTQ